jgi:hypothetical protein
MPFSALQRICAPSLDRTESDAREAGLSWNSATSGRLGTDGAILISKVGPRDCNGLWVSDSHYTRHIPPGESEKERREDGWCAGEKAAAQATSSHRLSQVFPRNVLALLSVNRSVIIAVDVGSGHGERRSAEFWPMGKLRLVPLVFNSTIAGVISNTYSTHAAAELLSMSSQVSHHGDQNPH